MATNLAYVIPVEGRESLQEARIPPREETVLVDDVSTT